MLEWPGPAAGPCYPVSAQGLSGSLAIEPYLSQLVFQLLKLKILERFGNIDPPDSISPRASSPRGWLCVSAKCAEVRPEQGCQFRGIPMEGLNCCRMSLMTSDPSPFSVVKVVGR